MSFLKESVLDVADQMHKTANALQEAWELPTNYTLDEFARDLRAYANRVQDAHYMEKLDAHRRFLDKETHDEGDLAEWYIHSVSQDDPPVWTKEHLKELVQDYWLIPRPMDERFKRRQPKKGGAE